MLGKSRDQIARDQRFEDLDAKFAAIGRSQAIIEFQPDGTILWANDNFLGALGYGLNEIVGKHHRMFVDKAERESAAYEEFWRQLRSGQFSAQIFRRINKAGGEIYIQASYNPVLDGAGKTIKVIKLAVDVTRQEQERIRMEAERVEREAEQSKVVTALAASLKALSNGDLTTRITERFPESYEVLRADFNGALDAMENAIQSVAEAVHGMKSGSVEIASASNDLSRRTEQQAASLEETAAALDEITSQVTRGAAGAKQAAATAADTREDAARSGAVMNEAVAAMREIETGANKISQIISVIDEIAFQTNLLALNAGVEAARAGEAGRGFAVVAQEVRALAQRSADAAKEIKGLISESAQQVQRGARLVGDTGAALTGIVSKVAEIDTLIAEIATSAQEQSTGLTEVNSAVNNMDQVTQQNAAMVEESSAAAAKLQDESAGLAQLIGRFRVSNAGPTPVTTRHTPQARPVAAQQARVAKHFARGGAAPKTDTWDEF